MTDANSSTGGHDNSGDDFLFSSLDHPPTGPASRPLSPDEEERLRTWNAGQVLDALKAEADAFGLDEKGLADKIFREGLPLAAASIVDLSRNATTEKMRFDAGRYVVERNLGSITKEGDITAKEKDPIDELLDEVTEYANTGGGKAQ